MFDLGVVSDARYGAPYISIDRADLQRILADAVLALSEAIDVPFKWALMTRSATQRWSEGRVTLSAMRATPHGHFSPKAR